jgi:hypothetical protein
MGELIEAGCFKHPHIIDPHTSELLAWREGLEAAVRLGISEVILQTECRNLVKLWHTFSRR